MISDETPFAAWFAVWKPTRPEMTPIGWYTSADLEAAFNAGVTAMDARTAELVEHVLREQDTQD